MAKETTNIRLQRPKPKATGKEKRLKLTGVNTALDQLQDWWLQPEDQIASVIGALVLRLDSNNIDYRERFMRYARLYGNYEALGFSNLTSTNTFQQTNNLPVYNIIQSAIDTVMSKIIRDNPKPYFITEGADYFEKLKAEKMTQFVQGVWEAANFYQIANNKVFRDAAVYGLGGIQWEWNKNKKRVECEWVFIDEIKVDLYDAQKGDPRSLHRCKMIPKEMLIAKYPEQEELINQTTTAHPSLFRSTDTVIDFVVYTESWHLSNGIDKGRHVVSLTDKVLLDEEWDYDWFPINFFTYYEKPVGLYGRGITESILSAQIEINKILFFIQQCQELQASPIIVTDSDAQISSASLLNNRVARLVKIKSGTMVPQFISPSSTGPEIYQHLQNWMSWAYQEVGVSQTSVNGTKQEGVNSAVALRTMVDIESSRFIQVSKAWEHFMVDCAETTIKVAQRAYTDKANKDMSARYTDKKSKIIKEIPWSKINLPEDMFVIKCDTISAFPSSAAGRIQTITDFISNNFISKERGFELLEFDPDLEGEMKLATSSLRLTEKRLCDMVEEGIYFHPEKYMNLKLSLSVSEMTYTQLQVDDCPDDRLELVRTWIREITTMLTGNDPEVLLLQQTFNSNPPAAPIANQAGINPR